MCRQFIGGVFDSTIVGANIKHNKTNSNKRNLSELKKIKALKWSIAVLYLWALAITSWVAYICYCDLKFDAENTAGVLVDALSTMVAILLGWQICQTIISRDEVKKIKEISDDVENARNEFRRMQETALGHISHMEANLNFSDNNQAVVTLQLLVNAVDHYARGNTNIRQYVSAAMGEISALINNSANLGSNSNWVISNRDTVDINIDSLAATISTIHDEQIQHQIRTIRDSINRIRNGANTSQ